MESKESILPINHLAHDLNNILTKILNSTELLKIKVSNYEEVKALLSSIENGTYMAAEIIDDVVSETTNKIPNKKRINLNTLINDLINTIGIQLNDKINFDLKLEQSLYLVEGRYSDFYRVLMNLIVNSSEAIKVKGSISINTTNVQPQKIKGAEPKFFEWDSFVQIKISDDGEGIDPSIMSYIFDEKFTTKTKKKNAGIGLSIVKKIVEGYGGVIKVTSEINKGTEFTLKFPAIISTKEVVTDKPKCILIAEDEDVLRELLAELLVSYNYTVITTSNGEEVLEELNKKYLPDLLIIDLKMPDMDGLTCIRKIRSMNNNIPIILASGSRSEPDGDDDLNNIVNKIINKPYNFEEMLSVIKELIG